MAQEQDKILQTNIFHLGKTRLTHAQSCDLHVNVGSESTLVARLL